MVAAILPLQNTNKPSMVGVASYTRCSILGERLNGRCIKEVKTALTLLIDGKFRNTICPQRFVLFLGKYLASVSNRKLKVT